jgi:dihydrofolate synthase / folylpolyglutamate synthase
MHVTPEEIKKSLFALTTQGIKYDLDRIRSAAGYIGNPQNAYPSIHVAGTNGKGSTCAYIESILRAAGLTTGLFTSPHIVDFEERFRIDSVPVGESQWVSVYSDLREVINRYHLTFFEATMLMASVLFERRKVDCAIFETGLGGRLDATNILKPQVTVITNIAMDHVDYLGDTIEMVATEKLGIVKRNTPLVAVEPDNPDIREMIHTTCDRSESDILFIGNDSGACCIDEKEHQTLFVHNGLTFRTKMAGGYQIVNAKCAVEAVRRCGFTVHPEDVEKGIAETVLPCRFEIHTVGNKTAVLDVAHNPDAAEKLCTTLKEHFHGRRICIVAGIMKDKDYTAMMALYSGVADHIICTQPSTERAAPAWLLAEVSTGCETSVCPEVNQAVVTALQRPEHVVCITGSFFTVGEAVTYLSDL